MLSKNWLVIFLVCTIETSAFSKTTDDSESRKANSVLSGIQSMRESVPACRFSVEELVEETDRQGITKTYPSKWKVAVNSKEVLFMRLDGSTYTRSSILRHNEIVHSSDESAVIQGIATGSGAYAFDPRLLGICIGPFENSSMSNSLRSKDRSKLSWEMVELNSIRVNKVVITDHEGKELSFWVEPERGFRVHKYEYLSPRLWHEDISSEFDESFCKGLLPSKVVTSGENLVAGGSFQCTRIQSEFQEGAPNKFGLEDMGLTPGMPVSDIRIKKRIGYWNGTKLVDSPVRERGEIRMSAAAKEAKSWTSTWVIVGVVVGLGVLFGIRFLKHKA